MFKKVVQQSIIAAVALAAGCSHSSPQVELRGTPLSDSNQRVLVRAVERANAGRYDRVVVTITDRVVQVRK